MIPIIIACLLIGASAATIAWKWEDIEIALKGKKIAVLGARRVGKTTLLTYMSQGILIDTYVQTLKGQEVQRKRMKLGDLDIKLKKTNDISGSTDAYVKWKELFSESDLILYIVRTDQLLNRDSDTENRVDADLRQIQSWIKVSDKKQFFIVGNHWDSDPDFKNLKPDNLGDYADRFKALPVVRIMIQRAGGLSKVKVVLGSLKSKDKADRLITEIFEQVLKQ